MARRTEIFTQFPWTGGLNTSVDPGAIPTNDLQQGDNIEFSTSGARIRRGSFEHFDTNIPTLLAVKSSGTTRSLVFSSDLAPTGDDILLAGESIEVSNVGGSYDGDVAIDSIATTTPSNTNFTSGDVNTSTDVINITAHGYYTGLEITLTTTGTLPAGLSTSTTYYVIEVSDNEIALATSLSNAIDDTRIDITDGGSGTHTVNVTTVSNNTATYTAGSSLSESLKSVDASTALVERHWKFLGIHDFWYLDSGGDKQQLLVGVSDEPAIYRYDTSGQRQLIAKDAGATALDSSITEANFSTLANKLIISFDGVTTPKKYDPQNNADWEDLGGNPPNFRISQPHLGRLLTNDKDNPDRLHYSPPGDVETWGGTDDSGAFDIFPNDGDPVGITAILPPFKGRVFISKKTRMIQMSNSTPETFRLDPFTEGLGAISHRGTAAVDVDDVYFISDKGIHSIIATDAHGDYQGAFKSAKIQPDFNDFAPSRLKYTSAHYLSQINSIAFNVSNSDANTHDELWLYNVQTEEWYRWPDQSAEALTTRLFNDTERRFIFGTDTGRLIQSQGNDTTDYDDLPISYTIKTGAIYPDGSPATLKMFKRLSFYFKPQGSFTIIVRVFIDNQAAQTSTITQGTDADLLGTTFILGESLLGSTGVLAPFTIPVDGVGRGLTFEIQSTSTTNERVEVYGYSLEYEQADINQETI